MREPDPMAHYAVPGPDGLERVMHAIIGHQPEHARGPIADAECERIRAAWRQNEPAHASSASAPAPETHTVDLKPLHDQIAALKQVVTDHAALHDETARTLVEHDHKIESQAGDIHKVRENTAKAIAQMTEGIGEKPA